jgi:hypothetical protein
MFLELDEVVSLKNTIAKLTVNGDEATATVVQHFLRSQRKLGKTRNIGTEAIQDETWVRTPEGWKRQHVENVRGRRWYVDGTRIDPNKPSDPEAPPFNPPIHENE